MRIVSTLLGAWINLDWYCGPTARPVMATGTRAVVLLCRGDEPPSKEFGATGRSTVIKVCLYRTRSIFNGGYLNGGPGMRTAGDLGSKGCVCDAEEPQLKVKSLILQAWRRWL